MPFESRIDKESFELLMQQTMPAELVLLTSSQKRAASLVEFLSVKQVPVKVTQLSSNGKFSMSTNAAVKQLLIQPSLFDTLPLQTIMPSGAIGSSLGMQDLDWFDKINMGTQSLLRSCRTGGMSKVYQVSRIQAAIRRKHRAAYEGKELGAPDEQEIGIVGTGIDELVHKSQLAAARTTYEASKPSLYFRVNGEHSMRDLKHFLEVHNFQMMLLDGCLSYDDKVFIYFDDQKGTNKVTRKQLRFSGHLCQEYFQIRRLVDQHFGRL